MYYFRRKMIFSEAGELPSLLINVFSYGYG